MSVLPDDPGTGEAQGPKEGREANETGVPTRAREVTPSAMRRTLARARDGKPLDLDEATVLLHARGDDLDTLLSYASRTRDAGLEAARRPGIITYSRKVFIPLTRLCRDRCGYCTFATVPHRLDHLYLEPDEVLDIARQGADLGCKEALFTLGDKPEDRWHQARDWLDAHGYDDTLSYVRAMAIRVLEETGLLPHLNPGVLSWQDFQRLKPVAPSMGMMLETTATRLFSEKGGPHFGSPDKDPAVRLRVLEDAGRSNVPFTTGILIGIGETAAERAESVFAIRKVAREYGGVQEVIVQNFRAKPDTKMRDVPDAELDDLAATIAVTRLILGSKARIQAPPNLVGAQYDLILRAGIDDWGGVSPLTPDHVNPERPWPDIDELAAHTAQAGFTLRERLTIYPPYIREPWLDPRLARHVAALADPATGLAAEGAKPRGLPWQEPDGGWGQWAQAGRTDLHVTIDTTGRTHDRREDFAEVYGDWNEVAERTTVPAPGQALRPAAGRPAAGAPRPGAPRLGAPRLGTPPPGAPPPCCPRARSPPPCARPNATRSPSPTPRPSRCCPPTAPTWKRWPASPTRCAARSPATTSPTSSPATSTSPTSATPVAGSARSRSGGPTPTPTRCRCSRSATAPPKPGRPAPPRYACREASIPICLGQHISKLLPKSSGVVQIFTYTRSRRWRW